MLRLAVENSSDTGGVALLRGEQLLGAREWEGAAARGARSAGLFLALRDLLTVTATDLEAVGGYVVDVGPGAYSGLRAALAAVRAFAMPGGQPVYALTSSETLAWQVMREFAAPLVQVVGDARREQWWTCAYKMENNLPVAQAKLNLVAENDFCPLPGALVVSPDWPRLGVKLKALAMGATRLVEKRLVPGAAGLGLLACRKIELNLAGEPLRPIYLHAAVAGVKRATSARYVCDKVAPYQNG